jgi:hypothetical protein
MTMELGFPLTLNFASFNLMTCKLDIDLIQINILGREATYRIVLQASTIKGDC